mmetsp:Transcript_4747/g.15377  ORF Transcript_4747/g.15377 Transcript_4747/m.15377 type:complete len:105 (-) Transcript_4747:20-334(-)
MQHERPPVTVADGLKTVLGSNTFPVVRDLVHEVITVTEAEIVDAMRLIYGRLKLAAEPSAAVGLAVTLGARFRALSAEAGLKRVGVIVCGGNVDLDRLPWMAGK